MESSGKIEIKKFNGRSFELWKFKMEDLLVDKDQWIVVDLGEAIAKALWDKLGTLYPYKSLVNKLFLQKNLYSLRMKDVDSITEHLNAFDTVVSQLLSVDIKISDEDKCIILLCSLPDSWDSLVIAIGSNAIALQLDEIVSSLLTEKMRQKNMESQNGDALSEKTTSDEGGDVHLASSSTHVDHEAWLIDSSASFHFTPHREWFCEYEKYDSGDFFLGDDRKDKIVGRGKVKLNLQGGRIRTLPSVLHIPALARNLISVSKLDDAGVKIVLEKDTYNMVQGALVLMRGV
eukprot:PITA_11461